MYVAICLLEVVLTLVTDKWGRLAIDKHIGVKASKRCMARSSCTTSNVHRIIIGAMVTCTHNESTQKERTYCLIDLKSTMRRSHLPSRGSICNLLGELYAKLENIRASSIYLWQALNDSPFKISAYTNLCDIAPDIANFDLAATTNNVDMSSSSSSSSLPFASPDDLFKDFTPDTVHLDTTSTPHHPTLPTSSTHDIDEHPSINLLDKPSLGLYMPSLRKGHSDNISLDQLRSLVHYSHKMRDTDLSGIQPSR